MLEMRLPPQSVSEQLLHGTAGYTERMGARANLIRLNQVIVFYCFILYDLKLYE